jgi:hypothetical protein
MIMVVVGRLFFPKVVPMRPSLRITATTIRTDQRAGHLTHQQPPLSRRSRRNNPILGFLLPSNYRSDDRYLALQCFPIPSFSCPHRQQLRPHRLLLRLRRRATTTNDQNDNNNIPPGAQIMRAPYAPLPWCCTAESILCLACDQQPQHCLLKEIEPPLEVLRSPVLDVKKTCSASYKHIAN